MSSVKRIQVQASAVSQRFSALRGDRLTVALVGEYAVLEHIAHAAGATCLNAVLLQQAEAEGQFEDLAEVEEIGDQSTLRNRLEASFDALLSREIAGKPRLLLWGLEILMHWRVNLRKVRQYAVNDRPIGLLIPGAIEEDRVRFYRREPIDCDFDQIWEVLP